MSILIVAVYIFFYAVFYCGACGDTKFFSITHVMQLTPSSVSGGGVGVNYLLDDSLAITAKQKMSTSRHSLDGFGLPRKYNPPTRRRRVLLDHESIVSRLFATALLWPPCAYR